MYKHLLFRAAIYVRWNFSFWIFRFLESQLHGQRSQQEEELKALQQQLSQAICGYSSGAQSQVSAVIAVTLRVLAKTHYFGVALQFVIHLRALYMYRTSVT